MVDTHETKTVRENNLDKTHDIPFGTLVEIDCESDDEHGCRMFVVEHQRDCDGSVMYGLSHNKNIVTDLLELQLALPNIHAAYFGGTRHAISSGWGEESLIVI